MGNMCTSYCDLNNSQSKKCSLRNSYSFYDIDIDQIMINNTALNLISQDVYKYLKKSKVESIFCIQDSHLEFPDKTFRNYVGDSVIKECKEYIKLHEDLILNKVMHTKGGKANCNYIIHGGYMKDYNDDNDAENMRRLIKETLTYANDVLKCKSILFPLNQLKTYTTKACVSVILACQNFIIENSEVRINNIYFVGNGCEETSIRLYRSALNANQKTEQYNVCYLSEGSYQDPNKLLSVSDNQQIKPDRTSSKKQIQPLNNQFDANHQNKNTSINKSQNRTSSFQSEIKDVNISQLNKSGIRMQKSKNNLEDGIQQQEEIRTQADLEQETRNRRASSSRQQSCQNLSKQQYNSHGSGLIKEFASDKPKNVQKKELTHYNNPFEQQINFDEQSQLQKSMNEKKQGRKRNMKTEFMQTNISNGKEDDETSEKRNSFNNEFNEDSFKSGLESDQITSLLNPNRQQYQQDSLFYNVKLNQNKDSNDMHNIHFNSNYQSIKLASSNQNIYSNM